MTETIPPKAEQGFARRMPAWQVLLVLVGFPALYLANSFTPWAARLFGGKDHGYFVPFFVSGLLLHWISVALVVALVWRAGCSLREIGLDWRAKQVVIYAAVVLLVGLALTWVAWKFPLDESQSNNIPAAMRALVPQTIHERLFWIFAAFSAGICEELVYRGFGVRVLQSRGWKTWQAVVLTSLSFVFMHGLGGLYAFSFYLTAGLLLGSIFVWRGRLAPVIYLHAFLDLMAILAA